MGIANHPFYQTYEDALNHPSGENTFYAMLMTKDNKWLDSHKVGIDGPLMFHDKTHPERLHLYILSFERHALVGHYTIPLQSFAQSA